MNVGIKISNGGYFKAIPAALGITELQARQMLGVGNEAFCIENASPGQCPSLCDAMWAAANKLAATDVVGRC